MNLGERRWVAEKMLGWEQVVEDGKTFWRTPMIKPGNPGYYYAQFFLPDFEDAYMTGPLLFALCRIARERCIRVRLEDWYGYSDDGHNGNIEVYLYDNNDGKEEIFDIASLNLALIAAARKILEDK